MEERRLGKHPFTGDVQVTAEAPLPEAARVIHEDRGPVVEVIQGADRLPIRVKRALWACRHLHKGPVEIHDHDSMPVPEKDEAFGSPVSAPVAQIRLTPFLTGNWPSRFLKGSPPMPAPTVQAPTAGLPPVSIPMRGPPDLGEAFGYRYGSGYGRFRPAPARPRPMNVACGRHGSPARRVPRTTGPAEKNEQRGNQNR